VIDPGFGAAAIAPSSLGARANLPVREEGSPGRPSIIRDLEPPDMSALPPLEPQEVDAVPLVPATTEVTPSLLAPVPSLSGRRGADVGVG